MSGDPRAAERKRLLLWIALGGVALVLLLALKPEPRRRSADTTTEAPPASTAAAPGPLGVGPLSSLEWSRIEAILPDRRPAAAPDGGESSVGSVAWDAFRPMPGPIALVAAADARPASPDGFRLEGVSLARDGARRHAILNDRVVRVGDEVDGLRVVSIERGRVVLEGGGQRTAISIRSEKTE